MPQADLLVAYDIATSSAGGEARQRRVAQACLRWGQRVQGSVVECSMRADHVPVFVLELKSLIEPELDSVYIYSRPKDSRKITLGRALSHDLADPLVL